ncbi:MAG: 50S ribosomal protein L24 [Planctomycetota bacterium]
MAGRHVRTGDTVKILSGRDKGRTGKVLRIETDRQDPSAEKVVVEGVNVRTKHVRQSQANPRGGMTQVEMPIHISNVSPVDSNGKATRVRFETKNDGSKVRVAVTTGETLGEPLKKAKK